MLVELPATVPDFDRDLAETVELGVKLDLLCGTSGGSFAYEVEVTLVASMKLDWTMHLHTSQYGLAVSVVASWLLGFGATHLIVDVSMRELLVMLAMKPAKVSFLVSYVG